MFRHSWIGLVFVVACSGGREETFDDCRTDCDGGGSIGEGDAAVGDGSSGTDGGLDAGDGSSGTDGGLDAGDGSGGADGGLDAGDGSSGADGGLDAGDGSGGADGGFDAGDGSSGLDAGGGDGGTAFSCTPGERFCASETLLSVCNDAGDAARLVTCDRGCDFASDAPRCLPSDLSTASGWEVRDFPTPDDPQPSLNYSISEDGLVATQTVNGTPGIYVNSRVFTEVVVTGRFSVQTTSDDDLIGFVFGYQDDGHYYLLDWKKVTQAAAPCNTAESGLSLKRVSSDTTPNSCADFWGSIGTDKVGIISPASVNPTGWVTALDYDFRLHHAPGFIDVEIRQAGALVAAIQSTDDTYAGGRFGFYNYSQSDVRYELFRFE